MQPDTFLHGIRTRWDAAPVEVHDWVLARTGPLTREPQDRIGGMATGVATVVHGTERSAFVKAVDEVGNPKGADMYRTEAMIAERLPEHPRIPTLLDAGRIQVADGTWWANLLQARPGTTPRHPWQASDLDRVLAAWIDVSAALAGTGWDQSAELSKMLVAWREIKKDPTDPWRDLARHWVDRESAMLGVIDGGSAAVLSHIDLRADNILLDDATGEVTFVDWAHPATAAPWADIALLMGDVVASGAALESGGDIDVLDAFTGAHPDTDPELAIAVVSSLAAFLHVRAHREQLNPAMPHRLSWSTASSERSLPFIEAHTR